MLFMPSSKKLDITFTDKLRYIFDEGAAMFTFPFGPVRIHKKHTVALLLLLLLLNDSHETVHWVL